MRLTGINLSVRRGSADGNLHLSAATVGNGKVKVLAMAVANASTGPGLNIAAAEVTVDVTVRPVVKNVRISPSGSQLVHESLELNYTTVPAAGVACTYRWETRLANTNIWQPVAGVTTKTWIPGSTYIDHQVRGFVVPTMANIAGVKAQSSNVVILYNKPHDIDHIEVNGYTFKHNEGFPTTAFKAATFTLVLPGDIKASDYSWVTDAGDAITVTVENKGVVVTFVSKPASAKVTITGQSSDNPPFQYSFNLKHWFTNHGNKTMTWSEANEACKNCKS